MRQKWSLRWMLGWAVLFLAGLGYELASLFDGSSATPPLTQVVVKYVPELAVAGVLGWLAAHFGVRYWRKKRRA